MDLVKTMRWFGPQDGVSLSEIAQAGCQGVVTALHQISNGEVWDVEAIQERRKQIEKWGLHWRVVESVPIHEDIKTRSGNYQQYINHYKTTLVHLAKEGIQVVTYNFMPVLDWTRTDLNFELPNGATALRFEMAAYIAFDVFILKRKNAEKDYSSADLKRAASWFQRLSPESEHQLIQTILAGLPGSEEHFTLIDFKKAISRYEDISREQLKENLYLFLQEIIPIAQEHGILLAIHPDDPPFSIFGLPRIIGTEADLRELFRAVPASNNGLCFCTGSFGVSRTNNLPDMVAHFADRIYFTHLRSTLRNEWGDFYEAAHLDGDVDMVRVIKGLLSACQTHGRDIYMRPDHGHQMAGDLGKDGNPGYTYIGRLKGLSEISGIIHALKATRFT
jgi:mannonate dehydratase